MKPHSGHILTLDILEYIHLFLSNRSIFCHHSHSKLLNWLCERCCINMYWFACEYTRKNVKIPTKKYLYTLLMEHNSFGMVILNVQHRIRYGWQWDKIHFKMSNKNVVLYNLTLLFFLPVFTLSLSVLSTACWQLSFTTITYVWCVRIYGRKKYSAVAMGIFLFPFACSWHANNNDNNKHSSDNWERLHMFEEYARDCEYARSWKKKCKINPCMFVEIICSVADASKTSKQNISNSWLALAWLCHTAWKQSSITQPWGISFQASIIREAKFSLVSSDGIIRPLHIEGEREWYDSQASQIGIFRNNSASDEWVKTKEQRETD